MLLLIPAAATLAYIAIVWRSYILEAQQERYHHLSVAIAGCQTDEELHRVAERVDRETPGMRYREMLFAEILQQQCEIIGWEKQAHT